MGSFTTTDPHLPRGFKISSHMLAVTKYKFSGKKTDNHMHVYANNVHVGVIHRDNVRRDHWHAVADDGTCVRMRPFGNKTRAAEALLIYVLCT